VRTLTTLILATTSLQRAPARSTLTSLGIVIGVAAIVATNSIGAGARARIQQTLEQPVSRTIFVGASQPATKSRWNFQELPASEGLSSEDYYAIRDEVQHIAAASRQLFLPSTKVKAKGRTGNALLEGIDVEGFITIPRRLLSGALFSHRDLETNASVCVISISLARELYGDDPRLGSIILVNDVPFTIVGLVDDVPPPDPASVIAPDLHIYAPYSSVRRRISATTPLTITVQAEAIEHVSRLQQELVRLLEARRNGRSADFRTSSAFESIQTYAEGSRTMAGLLAALAAIALVVGGIGIMNIMLVSVAERTREIGIRMALGTRSRDVQSQFLMEAIALSIAGCTAGIGLGFAASALLMKLNDWPIKVTFGAVSSAILCGVLTGLAFGIQPARRAAALHPIQALRAE
jgi:putative ABC transport system permease protein